MTRREYDQNQIHLYIKQTNIKVIVVVDLMSGQKKIKISLSQDQYDTLMNVAGSWFYDMDQDSEEHKSLDSLFNAIIKGYNKSTNSFYLWQLIDQEKPTTPDNISPHWRGSIKK